MSQPRDSVVSANQEPIEVVVFDADGTFLLADDAAEASYEQTFKAAWREATGDDISTFERRWIACEEAVRHKPDRHGFILDEDIGIVAGPLGDVMMECRAIAYEYRRQHLPSMSFELFGASTYASHKVAYGVYPVSIDPDLKTVLEACECLGIKTCVVTNSARDAVQAKIASLSERFPSFYGSVYGMANKFSVNSMWDEVPAYGNMPGLDRRVHLRRKMYNDALLAARAHGLERIVPSTRTLVAGDNAELDLFLADALGMNTALREAARTQPWEAAWARASKRCTPIRSLLELIPIIERSRR